MHAVFRVDASAEIGTGHLRRCLTLADALRDRGVRSTLVMRRHDAFLDSAPVGGHERVVLPEAEPDAGSWLGTDWTIDADQTLAVLDGETVDFLVVDHYALDARWERALRGKARRMLVIDDLADRAHICDLLLDTTPRDAGDYVGLVPASCEMLLGPRFALLRPEFEARRSQCRPRRELRRILVSFGGSDQQDFTGQTVRALAGLGFALDVVMTSGAAHLANVERVATQEARCTIHVDCDDMATLMATADLAIGAGGTTSWERLCLGLPSLATVIADNQRAVVKSLRMSGAAIEIPAGSEFEPRLVEAVQFLAGQPGQIAEMSERAAALVDGRGAARVAARLTQPAIEVRRAEPADMRQLWEWRNDARVRAASRDSSAIALDSHRAWFEATLQSQRRDLLVVNEQGGPAVAVLRFDLDAQCRHAEVSIYATPSGLGRGLGAAALRAGECWLAANRPTVIDIRAIIREGNSASFAAFESAGYEPALRTLIRKVAV